MLFDDLDVECGLLGKLVEVGLNDVCLMLYEVFCIGDVVCVIVLLYLFDVMDV